MNSEEKNRPITAKHFRALADAIEQENSSAEYLACIYSNALSMQKALVEFIPGKPEENPRSGPCCYELEACDGLDLWIGTGCDCGNYNDAQSAAYWAKEMNLYLRSIHILEKYGLLDIYLDAKRSRTWRRKDDT